MAVSKIQGPILGVPMIRIPTCLGFPESIVKGLTTEVAVASYNGNSLNII